MPRTIRLSAAQAALLGPIVVLVAVWLLAAYRAGGYLPHTWLPLALVVGLAGLVVAVLGAYGCRPAKPLLLVLGLFLLYVIWMALSATWALGPALAWEEAARAGFYLMFFALAIIYLAHPSAARSAHWLLLAAALVIVAISIYRLYDSPSVGTDFFLRRRFAFPITYANGAGAFYLLLVWPLLWMAADPNGRLWARALSLGTIPALLQLGLLTQSRGAVGALLVSTVLYFVLSPARVRSLVFLLVPGILVALSFTPLTAYYAEGVDQVDKLIAVYWLAASWLAAVIAGVALGLIDRHVRLSPRVRLIMAAVVCVALIVALALGILALQDRVGSLTEWVSDMARSFAGDEGSIQDEGLGDSRIGSMSGNGRWLMWTTAWKGYQDSPVLGNGAGSYPYLNELYRTNAGMDARQAHSIQLDALSETGIVGLVLLMATVVSGLGVALLPRFRAWWALARMRRPLLLSLRKDDRSRSDNAACQAWSVALLTGFLFWFVQASVDWTWHFPGVTLGALLLLAYALSTAGARFDGQGDREGEGARPTPAAFGDGGFRWTARLPDWSFRVGLGIAAIAVLTAAALPYLSMQYQNAALAKMRASIPEALEYSSAAETLFPVAAEPIIVRADIYRGAAMSASTLEDHAERSRRVAGGLALAAASHERAIAKEEASSLVRQIAGIAVLDLLAAKNPEAVHGTSALKWAGLAAGLSESDLPTLGSLISSLAGNAEEAALAQEIVALSDTELVERAKKHLRAAHERNPLARSITRVLESLGG